MAKLLYLVNMVNLMYLMNVVYLVHLMYLVNMVLLVDVYLDVTVPCTLPPSKSCEGRPWRKAAGSRISHIVWCSIASGTVLES